jgi:hypothetical protein
MGALAVAMATEDNERDAQYKLSLAQSFDQEPRKEDPQATLTCVHACANQKKKKNHHDAQKKKNNNNNNSLPFFLSANWISRSTIRNRSNQRDSSPKKRADHHMR